VARREPRFRIDRELGSGATGRVFHGVLTEAFGPWPAGFELAVKTLHPHLATDPVALETFEAEALAGRSIEHPNVVHVLHGGTDARGPYLLMNFVPGGACATSWRRRVPSPSRSSARSRARSRAGSRRSTRRG
jgi:serine/threonine protein kinase